MAQRVREIANGSGPCVGETNPMLGEPTRSEKKAHEITHVPAASWCLTCLHEKSRDDPCATAVIERGPPRLQPVFCFLKEDIDRIAPTNPWATKKDMVNENTGSAGSLAIPTKSSNFDYYVRVLANFARRMAHKVATMRAHGEVPINAVAERQ